MHHSDMVIEYLNKKTGKNFRLLDSNRKFIKQRLNEGYTVEDCLKVIDNKLKDNFFRQNPKYLNPKTLFRASNFASYLEEEGMSNADVLRGVLEEYEN